MRGHILDPRNRDSHMQSVRSWLTELGELEGSFNRSDLAALKAHIAEGVDVLRLPYAPTDSRFQRRTSDAASVNGEGFLRDDTGNTRFWVLPVVSIAADHDVDMGQLWAQVLKLWRDGEAHWLDQQAMQRVSAASERWQQVDVLDERFAALFDWDVKPGPEWKPWSNFELARLVGRDGEKGIGNRVARIVRKLGAVSLPPDGKRRGWTMPPQLVGNDADAADF